MVDTSGLSISLVPESSGDWDAVCAYLSVCARSSRVVVGSLWKISSASLEIDFNRKSGNKISVPCWIPLSELDEHNDARNVCQRGFFIDDEGLIFEFNRIRLDNAPVFHFNSDGPVSKSGWNNKSPFSVDQAENDPFFLKWFNTSNDQPDRTSHHFFLCDVSVGYTVSVDSYSEAHYMKRQSLPPGYDSVLITLKDSVDHIDEETILSAVISAERTAGSKAVSGAFGESDKNIRVTETGLLPPVGPSIGFKVFDNSQVFPRFLVRVDVFHNSPELFSASICQHCGDRLAAVYCLSDTVKLCSECDTVIHSGNAILRKHHRVPLQKAPPDSLGKCEIHCQEEYAYFCIFCESAVCSLCKNQHKHEMNNLDHLTPLIDAFFVIYNEKEKLKADRVSPASLASPFVGDTARLISERKATINGRIQQIDSLIASCNKKASEARLNAKRIIQGAADQLMYWCERNLADSLGSQLYHVRHLNYIDRGTLFIKYLAAILPPADFLRAWLNYRKIVQ